jgi:hypothetical protein
MTFSGSTRNSETYLITSDNKKIKVDKTFINSSNLLRELVSDLGTTDAREIEIPINLHSDVIGKITDVKIDTRSNLNFDDLSKLILAANYLEIPPLINSYSKAIADFLKSKTIEELEALSKM